MGKISLFFFKLRISLEMFTQTLQKGQKSLGSCYVTFCSFLFGSHTTASAVLEGEWNCIGGSSELSKFIKLNYLRLKEGPLVAESYHQKTSLTAFSDPP